MKWVYNFAINNAEGSCSMKDLLGGKGANLAEMCALGVPVPQGFTIITKACASYYDHNKCISQPIKEQILKGLANLEESMGLKLGDKTNPLLISIRSGAKHSMPGMMDTILNLGLNDETVEGLALKTSNPRFAYDSYRRFIEMYSNVVLEIDRWHFEEILDYQKEKLGIENDYDIPHDILKYLIGEYKNVVIRETGIDFIQDVRQQMWYAIAAVFNSWMSNRAIKYREIYSISDDCLGSAVNVQAMVFGNMGINSATGVAFTRNPSTGTKELFGEFLVNAQGEDVVAGVRTPQQISQASREKHHLSPSLEELMPEIYAELRDICKKLELHNKDMQDIEFTIQEGKLWILQTRSAKRTAKAAFKVAFEMHTEGIISEKEAILMIQPGSLGQLLHPVLDKASKAVALTVGLPASPGAASGIVVFSSKRAEELGKHQDVILVRHETSPEDISGINIAKGILTARGGMTSHAAVVARGMGKPCVSGASQLLISYDTNTFKVGDAIVKEMDKITISGATGEVFLGEIPTIQPESFKEFDAIMNLADKIKTLGVRANAETENDAKTAIGFAVDGIGLCRTEHMFFAPERILAVRKMILAYTNDARTKALEDLIPYQKEDFKLLFSRMQNLPVTIRLLDPPLHEFLPQTESEIIEFARLSGLDIYDVSVRLKHLSEANPMLGHRGSRLAITFPEIYEMQVRAILETVIELKQEKNLVIIPEIMMPLILDMKELKILKALVQRVADEVQKTSGVAVKYLFGTMIELPRAVIEADKIAAISDFLSFGTNDLTQTTLGLSRDDAANFLGEYIRQGIFQKDPFASIDKEGVGVLVKMAVEKARSVNPQIKIGVCGEHGGDPESIAFFNSIGIDYISCSPYRIPIARIAAAQSAINL